MKYHRTIYCLFLFLIGINLKIYAGTEVFIKKLPEFSGGIKPEAVWDSHVLSANHLETECHGAGRCTATIINKLGAGKQAVAFARWRGSLITAYKTHGNVYYFKAWLPGRRLRAGVFIGNNNGAIFEIDNWLERDGKKPLDGRKVYLSQLARSYFNAQVRYGVELPPLYKKLAHDRQELIFKYPLLDRCKGVDGCVEVGFVFNRSGKFIKAVFLGIAPHTPAYKVSGASACEI